jgi:DNA-directed RNA polymerase subunit RPC12/RpoP
MNEPRPRRPMMLREAYERCWRCRCEIEIPCEPPHRCPNCSALLNMEPREREIPRPKGGGRAKELRGLMP